MDNVDRARLTVLNRKHQFIFRLGEIGRTPKEAKAFVDMIDWEVEMSWAIMCYDHCDQQALAEAEKFNKANQGQSSGS
jgi:hypothetical protein